MCVCITNHAQLVFKYL